jgi:hypothetical protein
MSVRQISTVVAQVEYKPAALSQVSSAYTLVEYKPGSYRQISSLTVQVEYTSQEYLTLGELENTLTAIGTALHGNPNTDVSGLVAAYKSAIEAAFGVSLTVSGGDAWTFISLHFARQGLEAVARAFERWVETKIVEQGLNTMVDRYALFQRIMKAPFEIINVGEVNPDAIAQVIAPNIIVYRVNETRQWVMTPNNLIHELGHKLDGLAGFGVKRLGSLEYTIESAGSSLHDNYSRAGMAEGRSYLRVRALEHSQISLSSTIPDQAVYTVIQGKQPTSSDPAYAEFVPHRYMYHDIANDKYSVWQSPVYTQWAGSNARIDTLVINETADKTETAADAFLNWVRHRERPTFVNAAGESQAAGWISFFANNMGMFLRNAAIYGVGMVQFYKDEGIIPQTSITPGTRIDDAANVRLTPDAGTTDNLIGTTGNYLNINLEIYGWSDATPSGTSPYWLLVADNRNRLVWVASGAIQHISADITPGNKTLPSQLALMSPSRSFASNDLSILLGE